MFQRLNNMFVGEINNLPRQEPEFSEKEEEEWILVDFIDTCTNFSMIEEEEEVEEEEEEEEEEDIHKASPVDNSPVCSCLPPSLECLADASESCFIQFDSCPMEESWFITPPPCFTAGGLTALKVETSPLENLLIEHPSMSVYAVHNTRHSLNKTSCGGDEEEEEEEEEEETEPRDVSNPRSEAQSERGQHIRCYFAAITAHSTFLEQTKSFRPSQWIKEHNKRQYLNRNCLRRQNLTRDCYSRQLKNNGLFVHQPCQRQYNY
uniref:Tumor protein p53 inducible nuclear protein 1 n=1 Tax=Podarcis muralis TaxID=64176 RepID=A0A670K8T7_PODMU|nr:tumor protein p53-inducible nuclear protein 1 [Podarcis muralis]XP_028592303.1 tumor protein p53-inducible nuclear protein 1 [Podarcis muralis]XP_028592304.1 tumor protein p53-inducible nuclear protein 1 [Podarcis muralis]XP_028592305.1 tumor protein p53-inducible nuclear protein 1 [Podarcis muralis]XP_028592306.1 tumor protein p53-inducible nuclear protein 1 [Podarcis muralis]XP_028592307.1 tumor protein p53-inducible nuclear protein 1 [Podarcis muralis]